MSQMPSAPMADLVAAQAFWLLVRDDIPMLRYMNTALTAWDGKSLRIDAPLAPNINDKGSAFAGSLATLATITGWAALTLWSNTQFKPCYVAVAKSQIRYQKPVMSDFYAIAHLPCTEALESLRTRMASHGRGRLSVEVTLHCSGEEAVEQVLVMEASYAVWPREA